MTNYITFDDSVNALALPQKQDHAVYYADGHYANFEAVKARLPHSDYHGITVEGVRSTKIACVDCETGDVTPEAAIAWADWEVDHDSPLVIVYANYSTWTSYLLGPLAKHGKRIKRWVAAYDDSPEVPEGFDAHQWAGDVPGANGGLVDKNVAVFDFFYHWKSK
jgi:hypothetical protein